MYDRLGINYWDDAPDYLGTMLECASMLNADADVGRTCWPELWNGHLARWVPRFCSRLRTSSRLQLYRTLAERLCVLFPELEQSVAKVA